MKEHKSPSLNAMTEKLGSAMLVLVRRGFELTLKNLKIALSKNPSGRIK